MEYKLTHEEEALSRLATQYQEKARMRGLISVTARQAQALEDAAWSIHQDFHVDSATGAQLDVLGRLVGQEREGRDDETYRLWIRARLILNRSSGAVDDLLAMLRLIVPEAATLSITPAYPAGLSVAVGVSILTDAQAEAIASFVHMGKAGGVSSSFLYLTATEDSTFTLSDSGGADTDGLGLGDTANTETGGALRGAIPGER